MSSCFFTFLNYLRRFGFADKLLHWLLTQHTTFFFDFCIWEEIQIWSLDPHQAAASLLNNIRSPCVYIWQLYVSRSMKTISTEPCFSLYGFPISRPGGARFSLIKFKWNSSISNKIIKLNQIESNYFLTA